MAELDEIVAISALDPAGALTGAELVPVVQGGETVRTTIEEISDHIAATIVVSGGGTEITEALFTGVIAKLVNSANWSDAYGTAGALIGGYWNGAMAVPSGPAEHDYYIEPIATPNGLPRHIVTFLKVGSVLKPHRIPYVQ